MVPPGSPLYDYYCATIVLLYFFHNVDVNSPYYIGTKLWKGLLKDVQKMENVYTFKKDIKQIHYKYKKV